MKRISYNLSEEQKQTIINDFIEKLNNTPLDGPNIKYSVKLDDGLENASKATLFIESTAYAKMMMYIRDTDTEIAWHGTAYRDDNGQPKYYIKDVFLYPQIVRSVTVDTDQEKYQNWLTELDDETFNNLRFQGHSHVNMGVTPSSVDEAYYDTILDVFKREDPNSFYIFTVMNKRGEMYLIIYDLANNIIYNKNDIDVMIIDGNKDLFTEITEQKTKFCETPKITAPTYVNTPKKLFDPKDPNEYIMGEEERYDMLINKYSHPDDYPSETDDLYNDLDKKYKNLHLSAHSKKHKKKR